MSWPLLLGVQKSLAGWSEFSGADVAKATIGDHTSGLAEISRHRLQGCQRITEPANAATAMICVATNKTIRPLPRAPYAKKTDATSAASIGKNNAWSTTGKSCQNPKSKSGDLGPLTTNPRKVQHQTATHPAVRHVRAKTKRRPPRVRRPSSYSAAVAVQHGRHASTPKIVRPQRTRIAPRLKNAYFGNIFRPRIYIIRIPITARLLP